MTRAALRAYLKPINRRQNPPTHTKTDSPFGVIDHTKFPPPMSPTVLEDPVVKAVAAAHGVSPAVAILAWHFQQGVVFNPRSMNAAHMLENIGLSPTPWWDVHLSADEMALLSSRPQVAL